MATISFSNTADLPAILLVAFLFVSCGSAEAGQNVERLVPYLGMELTGNVFHCTSDHLAAGGYWYEATKDSVEQGASIRQESAVTAWRITAGIITPR